ncbi:hypothetical protein DAPPUDRAFT_241072 [Daphnia pulex]|uniref:Uncharacterized protein n=1 Tax=Daphnia pulex TaxID=6669 RepID=E9GDC3_DAPPU|nr:hypothetical protein DAPPUDRAFT_241072 [Daphnia pulex]|eukprot:EFX82722.1 hypothetical protein DAPPUDRAFT_241072 [Daphnia pulex]
MGNGRLFVLVQTGQTAALNSIRNGQHDDDDAGGLHLVSKSVTMDTGQRTTGHYTVQCPVASRSSKREKQLHVMTLGASVSLNPPASPSTPFRFLSGRPAESSPSFRTRAS